MSNIIEYENRPDLESLMMSNGSTAVFISVMAIAMSIHASTEQQKRIAAWIASRDQGVRGNGIAGFDLEEIPWSIESFEADRRFLLQAVDAAMNREGWERLDYTPKTDSALSSLTDFRALLTEFSPAHVIPLSEQKYLLDDVPTSPALCNKHNIYLHSQGCVICNEG
jgi:hypothetical protein